VKHQITRMTITRLLDANKEVALTLASCRAMIVFVINSSVYHPSTLTVTYEANFCYSL